MQEGHVADAGVDRLAGELDAVLLERGSRLGHVRNAQRDAVVVRLERQPHPLGLPHAERDLAGPHLEAGRRVALQRQPQRFGVEALRTLAVAACDGHEVDPLDGDGHGCLLVGGDSRVVSSSLRPDIVAHMPAATDTARIRRVRTTAQLLAGPPARRVAAVPRQLLALQAQDLRAVRLAVRARSAGITAAGVNDALDRREVVIGWLCRGTLHMVEPEDYPWLLGLTGPPQRQANARRLLQEGFPPGRAGRAVRLIERALADGPMERGAIGEMLASRSCICCSSQAWRGRQCAARWCAAARRSCSPVTGWATARPESCAEPTGT